MTTIDISSHQIFSKSRYGDKRYIIERTDIGKGWFVVVGKSYYARCGGDKTAPTEQPYFDFEGGPFIQVGDTFGKFGKVVELMYKWTPTDKDTNMVEYTEPHTSNSSDELACVFVKFK